MPRRPSSWSIRSNAAVQLGGTLILAAVAVGYFTHQRIETELASAHQSAVRTAESAATSTAELLSLTRGVLETLARRIAESDMDPEACQELILAADAAIPFVEYIAIGDENGALMASSITPVTAVIRPVDHADWFQALRGGASVAVSDPNVGAIGGIWKVLVAVPIRDERGNFRGFVSGAINLHEIQNLLAGLSLTPHALVTIADGNGTVLARTHEPSLWVGQKVPHSTTRVWESDSGRTLRRASGLDGTVRVWAEVQLEEPNWFIYAGLTEETLFASVGRGAFTAAAVLVTLYLLLAFLFFRRYRRTTAGLTALIDQFERASTGELAGADPAWPREVTEASERLNRIVCARARAEESERLASRRYRSIVNNAPVGVVELDTRGRIRGANPTFDNMLAAGPCELVGKRIDTLFAQRCAFERLHGRFRKDGQLGPEDADWVRSDGSKIKVRLWARSRSHGGHLFVDLHVEDVTERSALEAEHRHAQRLDAMGALAGGVAHDFNNLLTVILGNTEIAMDATDDPLVVEPLREVVSAGDVATTVTRQLLAFSRKSISEPRAVHVNQVVDGLCRMFQRVLPAGITLEIVTTDQVGAIHIDPGCLEQVLLNLVVNARDASPEGGVIRVVTERSEGGAEGPRVIVRVEDDGCGMSEEIRGQIFEPFFTTKSERGGTGLGLATVYGIVTGSGGRISVESRPGMGTTLSVEWPELADLPEAREASAEVPCDTGPRRVLVVEDDPAVRRFVGRTLTARGHDVVLAGTPDDALHRLDMAPARHFDLLLTDVVMPEMDGVELSRQVRAREEGIQVMFMTGHPSTSVPAGARVIAKPFSAKGLAASVETLESRIPR